MGTLRRLLTVVFFSWVLLAAGPAAFAQEMGLSVRLVAPAEGATLAAGETAELEWVPLAGFDRFPEVEEWEAFLSLDGGATYPVRITPHLDQDLRRFQWEVPPFPARDARILLRFGDEHRETAVELPTRFSIAAPPAGLPGLGRTLSFGSRSATRGEPALPGQAGVVLWVEGSRRGGALRQRVADEPAGFSERFTLPERHTEAAEVSSPLGPEPPETGPAARNAAVPPASRQGVRTREDARLALAFDILLLIQRQNE
ncbi:MAG TPA: hypothetical protein VJ725_03390 [Thermoanaerobaculia bacterium]|nr:hypothetical protein [Thermoanaerobaculia bacterium]